MHRHKGMTAGSSPGTGTAWLLLFVVLMAAASTFFHYRGFGRENQTAELPAVYRAMDGDYLPRDFYTGTTQKFGPRYWYAHILAFFNSRETLPYVAFFLTFLINITIAWTTFSLARELFKGSIQAGILAVLMVLTIKTFHLGFLPRVYARYLLSSSLAVPFIFLAILAALRRRPLSWGCAAAAAVIAHPTFGAEGGALAFLVLVVSRFISKSEDTRDQDQKSWWPVVGAAMIFTIALALQVIPYLGMERIETARFMGIETFFRHPHHSVPSQFRPLDYLYGFLFLVTAGAAWWWTQRRDPAPRDRAFLFPFMTLVILVLCLGGYLFVEVFPLRIFAVARTFRLLFIVKWLGMVILAGAAAHWLYRKKGPGFGLTWMDNVRVRAGVILITVLLFLVSLGYYLPGGILPAGLKETIAPAMPEITFDHIHTRELEVARFSLANTPKNSLFLVPPFFGKFRLVAERAMVVDWRCFPFQDRAMVEWRERLFDCYGIPRATGHAARKELDDNYKKITGEKILRIREKYGCDYAVLYNETPVSFPVIYQNKKYKILSLR